MTALPLTLTYAEAKADLIEIAESAPDRSLENMGGLCLYFIPPTGHWDGGDLKPGEGCCIVGRVLEKHEVTYDDLQIPDPLESDDHDTWDLNQGNTVDDLAQYGILGVDDDALRLLSEAQKQQDSGIHWADAVRIAIELVEGPSS